MQKQIIPFRLGCGYIRRDRPRRVFISAVWAELFAFFKRRAAKRAFCRQLFNRLRIIPSIFNSRFKVLQIDLDTGEDFDYIGCEYPFGLDGENILLFNGEQIGLVYFLGYQDLDELHYRFQLIGEEETEEE